MTTIMQRVLPRKSYFVALFVVWCTLYIFFPGIFRNTCLSSTQPSRNVPGYVAFSSVKIGRFTKVESKEYKGLSNVRSGLSKTITDSCTQKQYTCDPTVDTNNGFVYFLNNAQALTVKSYHAQHGLEHLNYFHYTYASVKRLTQLTLLPIYILATNSVDEKYLNDFRKLSSAVNVRVIRTQYDKLNISTVKPYHYHTFGKLEVFNPENTDGKMFLAFMDSDTFALHNIDEIFCLPKRFGAVKRDNVPTSLRHSFNSGVFVFSPNTSVYQALLDDVVATTGTLWANGEQSILNRRFGPTMSCLPVAYNCVGFGGYGSSAKSAKCSIKGSSDVEVWKRRKVLHVKLSDRRFAEALPSLSASWRTYLPTLLNYHPHIA
mmetsp:Transcript_34615/g.58134  ORF Transcript_34615/g.58134 Transcript_34615/m.58134 type:complete len:375 (-) Transcript_34615:1640-2764(-)